MKIVIIGGTGLIGSNVTKKLRQLGHTVIAGSPSTGVNALTGEGLSDALQNAEVVIDLSNSPSFEDGPAINFFETVGRNILSAEVNAGVKHHLVLSIVGTHLMEGKGYMRGKKIQEDLVKQSELPYTIVRSTQFHEFVPTIAYASTQENEIRVSTLDFQPISSEDVALFISRFAIAPPANGTVEIAGPVRAGMSDFVSHFVDETGDARKVIPNDDRNYIGDIIPQSALVPEGNAYLGEIRFGEYLDSLAAKSS